MIKERCFKAAKDQMYLSDYSGQAKVGCVVYYKGTILSKGYNTNKTSLLQERYNKYRFRELDVTRYPAKNHAELAALKKIRFYDIDFSSVEVYIYRELRTTGAMALARPCESCMAFIKELGIKTIHYTTPDGYATEKLI